MNFNFELILFYLLFISGVIALSDILFFAPKRKVATVDGSTSEKMPMIFDYARSFFPVLLVVFFVRSFLYEPYRIPSGSLEPTLLVGDFILVNKFDYGIRLPLTHKLIFSNQEPQRGEIIVFRSPPKPSVNLIKRVIGVPGDHISYVNKTLYVNGKEAPQQFEQYTMDHQLDSESWKVTQKQENLLGVKHDIYLISGKENDDFKDVVVPKGMYFVMGDNRDDSVDSRYWGFMPEENIIGKANRVWMSWDSIKHPIRFDRLWMKI